MVCELLCEAATVAKLPALVVAMWLLVELGELWLGVMGMVLLGVLLDNMFDFMVAVLPVVGMLACVFSSGLTAVGFTGWNQNATSELMLCVLISIKTCRFFSFSLLFTNINFFFWNENLEWKMCTFVFLSLSVELSLEWLCIVELNDGDGIGEVQELVEVGVPPVSLLLLLSVVADEGIPTPDNSTSSRPIISS